ncbi:MAG: Na/Pi cotransporter family protein [Clostridia bacterium]|nr:Na/Pi cotransporter family protein [Clostridia bacterium]
MKKLRILLAVFLIGCTLLSVCSCGQKATVAPAEVSGSVLRAEADPAFEITVTDSKGVAVADVELHLCIDSATYISATTGENGIATFDAEVSEGDSLIVVSYPDGYEYDGEKEIVFEESVEDFSLEINKKGGFDLFSVLGLLGGLALFLYGMTVMGNALEKRAGNKLKMLLETLTSNTFKGFLLGLIVTLVIQSSSATTVMVVGFVNSGIMTLRQATGVIMGANLGTSVTAWVLSLTGIESSNFWIRLCKPSSFVPVLAVIGIYLFMFQKKPKHKDTGVIFLGFAALMFGMEMMSDAVSGLRDVPEFTQILTIFSNPILGVLAGTILTAIVQSSSASVGILQALTTSGTVMYATAIPVIMGQNIGTCVSAMISSVGASKNAKRAAVIHLAFNVIATLILLPIWYLVDGFVDFGFVDTAADPLGIATVHTAFKLFALLLLMPASRLLEKLANLIIKDDKTSDGTELLDERLLVTPPVAIARCKEVTIAMAKISVNSLQDSIRLLDNYDEKLYDRIREDENRVDLYEDKLGSYLVKLTSQDMNEEDSLEANKLLHVISDFERISDHALNIAASAEEIHDKKLEFSSEAKKELATLTNAIKEILDLTLESFIADNLDKAIIVEPLEQVVDHLKELLRKRHIKRLRKQECTIELGFVLTDILTNFERVSDHCSNIAACMLEISHDEFDIHEYLRKVKGGTEEEYNHYFDYYSMKYSLSE